MKETSGLIHWNNRLWTHNDDTDTNLYALDTLTGTILETYELPNVTNTDWEELSQDDTYFYLGDFGNNASGNRKDLHILRIEKNTLLKRQPKIDTIAFSYDNQHDFTKQRANTTDFDCEAFVVTQDSLYLFTKEWHTQQTSIYTLPKVPGNYKVYKKESYDVKGLITGAAYLESKKIIALCGYTKTGRPFLYLLSDFKGYNFFSGTKRRLKLQSRFCQIEGIATIDGTHFYLTNEKLHFAVINTPQQMEVLDLSQFFKSKIIAY
ncbi:MAG: T9SS C-terminal target domain-containing protein [Flavobacterium sp.]